MYITKFALEKDNTYWEAFATDKKGTDFTVKVRIIPTQINNIIVIRNYNTGYLLSDKILTHDKPPISDFIKASAVAFACEFFSNKRRRLESLTKEEVVELLMAVA